MTDAFSREGAGSAWVFGSASEDSSDGVAASLSEVKTELPFGSWTQRVGRE